MSDLNLLMFGCGVTFTAIGGAYIYIRECFLEGAQQSRLESESEKAVEPDVREFA